MSAVTIKLDEDLVERIARSLGGGPILEELRDLIDQAVATATTLRAGEGGMTRTDRTMPWPPEKVPPPPVQRIYEVTVCGRLRGPSPTGPVTAVEKHKATETHVTRSDSLVVTDTRSGSRSIFASGTWDRCESRMIAGLPARQETVVEENERRLRDGT